MAETADRNVLQKTQVIITHTLSELFAITRQATEKTGGYSFSETTTISIKLFVN